MKTLVLITARAGSKRIPKKNIKTLGDRPLIQWTLDLAKQLENYSKNPTKKYPLTITTLVSTDSPEIQSLCQKQSILCPWLRPEHLANDTASSVDVGIHALDWAEKEFGTFDTLLLLQPTQPFRKLDSVLRAIELYQKQPRPVPLTSVSPSHSHPWWTFTIEENLAKPFCKDANLKLRSQDLPKAYSLNGAIYLLPPQHLRENRSFYGDSLLAFPMLDPIESIDLDTPFDWLVAESALKTFASHAS